MGLTVDNFGNVYVADTGNHRIQKFNDEGKFIGTWGSLGSDDGQFRTPKGVAVDAQGNIYVADTKNKCGLYGKQQGARQSQVDWSRCAPNHTDNGD
jgi:DNA-binding beta-propeller fold protein YncE